MAVELVLPVPSPAPDSFSRIIFCLGVENRRYDQRGTWI
jgi:hypothetical protein